MAIKKDITLDSGVVASHWKATAITIDYVNMIAYSTAQGYVSQEIMDDKNNRPSVDTDTVQVHLFWSQEELEATKPKKSEELTTLELKKDRTPEEDTHLISIGALYEEDVKRWEEEKTRVVITQDMMNVFVTLLQNQHIFHLKGNKLKGGEIIADNTDQYDNKDLTNPGE